MTAITFVIAVVFSDVTLCRERENPTCGFPSFDFVKIHPFGRFGRFGCFALCGGRPTLRALDRRALFEKSAAKAFALFPAISLPAFSFVLLFFFKRKVRASSQKLYMEFCSFCLCAANFDDIIKV